MTTYEPTSDERLHALERQLAETERALLDVVAHEQARFAEELHDGLCQRLTTMSMLLGTLRAHLAEHGDARCRDLVERLEALSVQANHETRALAHSLYPFDVEQGGLLGALSQLADNVAAAYRLDVRFCAHGAPETPDPLVQKHLYRIVQEAVSNAIRHGRPARVDVRLVLEDDVLCLTVENDGATFDPAVRAGASGIGLRTMEQRAARIGGTFSIGARTGGGTVVRCCVPYPG